MTNFKVLFTNPWFLFLLIPAIAFTLWPYFKLSKKYRRTRNRIISIVLHTLIMVMTISMVGGMSFAYDIPNSENELMICVDMSDSNVSSAVQKRKDDYIGSVIDEAKISHIKVGIVVFGYGVDLISAPSDNWDRVYQNYCDYSGDLDTSATDIATALTYTKEQFKDASISKILLVSDGVETDRSALSIIRSLTAEGMQVDTICFSSAVGDEVQITDVVKPDHNVTVGEEFQITAQMQASCDGSGAITLMDNGNVVETKEYIYSKGMNDVVFTYSFAMPGMHIMSFSITGAAEGSKDVVVQNNTYTTYLYLQSFDQILIINRYDGDAERLKELLTTEDRYNVTIANYLDAEAVPASINEMRQYDQIILNNISNADITEMTNNFIDNLYSYVKDFGGSVLTVGGNKKDANGNTITETVGDIEKDVANLYNRADLAGSLYQKMMPVTAINYTPPLGVVIIIDISGSMSTQVGEHSLIWHAVNAALDAVDHLSERDYVGIMTLESDYSDELSMTPMTQYYKIQNSLNDLLEQPATGGTEYGIAIEHAALALSTLSIGGYIQKKHIVLISDGYPGDAFQKDDGRGWGDIIKWAYDTHGITTSMLQMGLAESGSRYDSMLLACEEWGHGKLYCIDRNDIGEINMCMIDEFRRSDLMTLEIDPVDGYTPFLTKDFSYITGNLQADPDGKFIMPALYGIYGTKIKDDAELVLSAKYGIPVYAHWSIGKGKVGSFMIDLNGEYSDRFMTQTNGQQFIYSVINYLMPTESIRYHEMSVQLVSENYTNQLYVYTNLEESQSIQVDVNQCVPDSDANNGYLPAETPVHSQNYTGNERIVFAITKSGVYEIKVAKLAADGTALESVYFYKDFAYSAEYNEFVDLEAAKDNLAALATNGKGVAQEEDTPGIVLEGFSTGIHKEYDPRVLFMILAIVFFLLDIAVRKFKFKWIHELVREYQEKKAQKV